MQATSSPYNTGLPAGDSHTTTAVVLLNLGTPESPDPKSVQKYLAEFLGDPEVISLPGGMKWATPLLARLIAFFRAKPSSANYRMIWTEEGSPLLAITRRQAALLEEQLGDGYCVEVAMRYGQPSLEGVFDRLLEKGIRRLLILPMYPHFSRPTTGTALALAYRLLERKGLRWEAHLFSSWHDEPSYHQAQARHIRDYTAAHGLSAEDTHLLFSAHSLPVSYIQKGDPYQNEIQSSLEGIHACLCWPKEKISVAYQSRLGPVEWIGPSTEHTLRGLAEKGCRKVVVCPISFTADCIETCHEIGIEYRRLFENELGGTLFLVPALNDSPCFIDCLKSMVLRISGGTLS